MSRPSEMGPGRPPQAQAVCACDDLLVAAQLALAVVPVNRWWLDGQELHAHERASGGVSPRIDFAGQGSPVWTRLQRSSGSPQLRRRALASRTSNSRGASRRCDARLPHSHRTRRQRSAAATKRRDSDFPTLNATSAGYASAMGLRVVRGRWIGESEPTPVVVINESLARREFGDGDPIGMQLSVQAIAPNPKTYLPSICPSSVSSPMSNSRSWIAPRNQRCPIGAGIALVVRTPRDPLALVPTLRSVMAELDPAQPLYDVQTFEDALASSVAPRRFTAFVLNAFALPRACRGRDLRRDVVLQSRNVDERLDCAWHSVPSVGSRWHGGRTRYAAGAHRHRDRRRNGCGPDTSPGVSVKMSSHWTLRRSG